MSAPRLIIAGSRTLTDRALVCAIIRQAMRLYGIERGEIVHGAHWEGVDRIVADVCAEQGYPFKAFPADWERYGKAAGPRRNRQMAEYGHILLLVWDGKSKGSRDMREAARERELPIYEAVVCDIGGILVKVEFREDEPPEEPRRFGFVSVGRYWECHKLD